MEIGRIQTLRIARQSPNGIYLSDGEREVLLPVKEVIRRDRPGDEIEVYVHLDSEDRIIATRRRPLAQKDEFAAMEVVSVVPQGAFLNQGLDKDLLLPHSECLKPVREGQIVVVRVLIDPISGRPVATTKLRKFLQPAPPMPLNQKVSVIVTDRIATGWRLVVDSLYEGGLFEPTLRRIGDSFPAWVRDVQEGRVLVSSKPQGRVATEDFAEDLRTRLQKAGGFLPFHDGSSADAIRREFGVSKSVFKRAVGTLLKSGTIQITSHGIRNST
ncbi:S1 RNA-binding domain-containing protein [soil metagenome]